MTWPNSQAWAQRLAELGVDNSGVHENSYGTVLSFSDPDGNAFDSSSPRGLHPTEPFFTGDHYGRPAGYRDATVFTKEWSFFPPRIGACRAVRPEKSHPHYLAGPILDGLCPA